MLKIKDKTLFPPFLEHLAWKIVFYTFFFPYSFKMYINLFRSQISQFSVLKNVFLKDLGPVFFWGVAVGGKYYRQEANVPSPTFCERVGAYFGRTSLQIANPPLVMTKDKLIFL